MTAEYAPCLRCARTSHPTNGRIKSEGRSGRTRGLCSICYNDLGNRGLLDEYPTMVKKREHLVEDLLDLGFRGDGPINAQIRQFAPRLEMSESALSKAISRARKKGLLMGSPA